MSVTATFMNLSGDAIIFRNITLVDKICLFILVLVHRAHGDVVEVTDLFISPFGADSNRSVID